MASKEILTLTYQLAWLKGEIETINKLISLGDIVSNGTYASLKLEQFKVCIDNAEKNAKTYVDAIFEPKKELADIEL